MEKNLRLRLVVRRHGLPEVRVLFTILIDEGPTVAKLVEHVNETIPLESGEWGLEDYVVEVRGREGPAFECLHFQPLASILEKDDEVFIRPLFSDDLKRRRLSGRHQITSDGKHLIDGVPFGRPRLKTPRHRPTIEISPRKRRRLVHDENDNTQELPILLLTEHGEKDEEDPTSVKIGANFDDAGSDDDEEGDDDFEIVEEADNDMEMEREIELAQSEIEKELRDLQRDAEPVDEDDDSSVVQRAEMDNHSTTCAQQSHAESQKSLHGLDYLDKLTALRLAFPTAPVEQCCEYLSHYGINSKRTYRKLQKTYAPVRTFVEMRALRKSLTSSPSSPTPQSANKAAGEEDGDESVSSVVKHYDQHGFPPGSINGGTATAQLAKALQQSGQEVKPPVHLRFDGPSTRAVDADIPMLGHSSGSGGSDSSASDDKDTTSDEDSNSDDDDPEELSTKVAAAHVSPARRVESGLNVSSDDSDSDLASASSDSDTDQSSTSDDDSKDEEPASEQGAAVQQAIRKVPQVEKEESASDDQSSVSDDTDDSDDESSDDGEEGEVEEKEEESDSDEDEAIDRTAMLGLANSQASAWPNAPTNEANMHHTRVSASQSALKEETKTATPPGQGLSKTQRRNSRRRAAEKRKNLVDAPHGQNVMNSSALSDDALIARKQALLETLASLPVNSAAQLEARTVNESVGSLTNGVTDTPPVAPTDGKSPETSPTQRRMKLDIGAGRRMIFGAIGLRTPKTKEEEDRIRNRLMKDVRPLVNHRAGQPGKPHTEEEMSRTVQDVEQPVEDDNPEAWRDKITYRAVECCQDGIELSEPPFPFVQRWDPQQALDNQDNPRGGKGKRKLRNQAQFYEQGAGGRAVKKRRLDSDHGEYLVDDTPMYDGTRQEADFDAAQDQAAGGGNQGAQKTDLDDLPSLPSALDSLSPLQEAQIAKGMVVTWKELAVSDVTGWQPAYVDLTALIVEAENGQDGFRVLLAKRDRLQRMFDDEGNRIYGRFEAPDETDEADDGYRHVSFSDMFQPRIVQEAVESTSHMAKELVTTTNTVISGTEDALRESQGVLADAEFAVHGNVKSPIAVETDHLSNGPNFISALEGEIPPTWSESMIPETNQEVLAPQNHGDPESGPSSHAQPAQPKDVDGISLTDNRRHEISQPISDGDFRNDAVLPVVVDPFELSSPSRQLGDTMQAAAAASKASTPAPSARPAGTTRGVAQAQVDGAADESDDQELAPAPDTPEVEYPWLSLPPRSESGSLQSGRQPDLGFGLDEQLNSPDHLDEVVKDSIEVVGASSEDKAASDEGGKEEWDDEDEYNDAAATASKEVTPTQSPGTSALPHSAPSSVNSLPSVADIFCTASTSHSARNRSKPAASSSSRPRKALVERDMKYEEEMRRFLDEDDSRAGAPKKEESPSEDRPPPLVRRVSPPRLRFRNGRNPPGNKPTLSGTTGASQINQGSRQPSKPSQSSRGRTRLSSHGPFQIPAGSQLISLLSSSPTSTPLSPMPHAEATQSQPATQSSIVGGYAEDTSSLPTGSGWIQKTGQPRRSPRRGASLSAAGLGEKFVKKVSSSQGLTRGQKKTSIRL